MARFAYTATEASGRLTAGTTKAAAREAAELALYERELRGIRLMEKKAYSRPS
jgi:type IV pilus assembly protein PilC